MTRRGVSTLVAVAALWLAARTLGVEQLHTAAVALLVLLLAAAAWIMLLPLRLVVDRDIEPSVASFGGTVTVRLQVRNLGSVPSPATWLEDAVPATLGQSPAFRIPVLTPHRILDLAYELEGVHRGRFVLGPLTAVIRDPFGLVQRRRQIASLGEVTVLPPVWSLPPGVPLGGASGSVAAGPRRPTSHGDELADIREYVRGDDLRAVHWASTAHRGKLMVRRAEEATSPRATVLLDIRRDRHRGTGPRSSFEIAVGTAASVAHHLAVRGRMITLLDRPLVHAPTPQPAAAWMPVLAGLEPIDVDLGGLLRQVATGTAGEGTLVAVITPPDPEELRALVRAGRGASSRLAVVLDTASYAGVATVDPAALRAVAGLRAAGWRATVLRREEQVSERWTQLLGRARSDAVVTGTGDGSAS